MKSDLWETSIELFEDLNDEFNFKIDLGVYMFKCLTCHKTQDTAKFFNCYVEEESYFSCKLCEGFAIIPIRIEDNVIYPRLRSWNAQSIKKQLEDLIQERNSL